MRGKDRTPLPRPPRPGGSEGSTAGSGIAELAGIGKILARLLKDHPLLAFLGLLVVVAGIVMVLAVIATDNAALMLGYLVVVMMLAGLGYLWEARRVNKDPVLEPSRTPTDLAHSMPPGRKKVIRGILGNAASAAAKALDVPPEDVRANIFALDSDGKLRIVPELMFNMDRADEASLAMPPGVGSTGRSFASGKPNFAVSPKNWGDDAIDDEQTRHVHPELEWIISIPIEGADKKPIWIMNVDGLCHRRKPEQLEEALVDLLEWSELAGSLAAQETPE